jgi:O-antigen/teichoic acid export membrane protein
MFIVRASGLITMPILTRFLTRDEYGILSVANSIGFFLLTLFGLGSEEFILRYYWEKDGEERKRLFGSFFILLMVFPFVVFVLPLLTFGKSIFDVFFSEVPYCPYIVLVIWTTWLLNLNILPLGYYKIRNQAKEYMLVVFLNTFTNIVFTLVLVVSFGYGALGPLFSKITMTVLFGFYFVYYTLREITIHLSWKDAKEFFSFNLPLLMALISGSFMNQSAVFVLQKNVPLSEVALFSVGASIAGLIPFFISSINSAWAPFFYQNVFQKQEDDPSRLFGYTIDYILLGVVFIITAIIVFKSEVIYILASSKYLGVCNVMTILIIGNLFFGMRSFASRGILMAKKNYILPIVTIVGTLIDFGMKLYFVPRYGIYGAAWTTALSFISIYVVLHIISQKNYKIEFHYDRIVKLVLAFVVTVLLAYLVDGFILAGIPSYVEPSESRIADLLLRITLKSLVVVTTYPIILHVLGYFNESERIAIQKLSKKILLRSKINV